MTRFHRRIILSVFIIAFFLSSPIMVLYAYGWRWDASTGRLMATGMIVYRNPTALDLHVTINGAPPRALKQDKLLWRISSVLPGAYRVSWSAQGYTPLERTVEVRAAQVTNVGDIRLIRLTEPFLLFPGPLERFTASPTRSFASWIHRSKDTTSLVLLNLDDGTLRTRPLPVSNNSSARLNPSRILWSMDGNVLIVEDQRATGVRAFAYHLGRDAWGPLLNLPESPQWKGDNSTLLALKEGTIVATNVWNEISTAFDAKRSYRRFAATAQGVVGELKNADHSSRLASIPAPQTAPVTTMPPLRSLLLTAYPWPMAITVQGWQCFLASVDGQWQPKGCQRPVQSWVSTALAAAVNTPTAVIWYDARGQKIATTASLPHVRLREILASPTTLLVENNQQLFVATVESNTFDKTFLPSYRLQELESWQTIEETVANRNGTRLYILGKRKGDAGLFLRLLQ